MTAEMVADLSKNIQEKLIKSPYWPKSGRIGLYAPVKNEVLTQKIFQVALESGLHVYFPRVEQGISLYEVNGPEDLQRGSWSIPEPGIECTELAADEALDLLVIPGIVFTKTCCRVGYGRGFYDKYIASFEKPITAVGLAYDFQIVDDVTLDTWDQPITAVLTEKNIYTR